MIQFVKQPGCIYGSWWAGEVGQVFGPGVDQEGRRTVRDGKSLFKKLHL